MQAQHLVIHDSSSNQLVEAIIPSLDFSQSATLQNVLHSQARNSERPLHDHVTTPLPRARSCEATDTDPPLLIPDPDPQACPRLYPRITRIRTRMIRVPTDDSLRVPVSHE